MSSKDSEYEGEIGFCGLTNAESDIINKFPDAPLFIAGLELRRRFKSIEWC